MKLSGTRAIPRRQRCHKRTYWHSVQAYHARGNGLGWHILVPYVHKAQGTHTTAYVSDGWRKPFALK